MSLKKMREKKGYSQHDLAGASNISVRTIQTYEAGYRNINTAKLETLCKFAIALDCKIENILDDEHLKQIFKLAQKNRKPVIKDEPEK